MANTANTREARFRIIETLLLWEGRIDNPRVRSVLDVQNVQASRILADYAEQYPENIVRTSPRAPYVASPLLNPSLSSGSIDEYLALVRATDSLETTIEDARVDFSEPVPRIFATILQGCRQQLGVTISYRSMTTPREKDRLIFPHSIVRAGRRWHARAWCTERRDYRDFVIGRIRSAVLAADAPSPKRDEDIAWNTKVPLTIAAHPALSLDQAAVIRDEYFAGAVSRRLIVRSCLLSYVIQDLRAAVEPKRELPPEFQLIVTNVDTVRRHLFRETSAATT